MMNRRFAALLLLTPLLPWTAVQAAQPPSAPDPALAAQLGADARGMREYIFVLLKTGPTRVPDGPERDGMFKGHFANMERLAKMGKLVAAGPFTGANGGRGRGAGGNGPGNRQRRVGSGVPAALRVGRAGRTERDPREDRAQVGWRNLVNTPQDGCCHGGRGRL